MSHFKVLMLGSDTFATLRARITSLDKLLSLGSIFRAAQE